jgi:hypothetical protein
MTPTDPNTQPSPRAALSSLLPGKEPYEQAQEILNGLARLGFVIVPNVMLTPTPKSQPGNGGIPSTSAIEVSRSVASHVLWFFSADWKAGATEPGAFTRALLNTLTRADPQNRALLARAYPGYVEAMRMAQEDEQGLAMLSAIARPVDGTAPW